MAAEDNTVEEDALAELPPPASEEADVEVEREEDAPAAAELDPETRARRDAALRHVRKLGDPVLRASALPVERFDEHPEGGGRADGGADARRARRGARRHPARGSAPCARLPRLQRGSRSPRSSTRELEWQSEELEVAEEGCLSLPGVHVDVERPAQVRVRAQDAGGKTLEIEAEGLEARVIQHEIDHLNGVLILDRISREARKEAMRAMREAQETASAA